MLVNPSPIPFTGAKPSGTTNIPATSPSAALDITAPTAPVAPTASTIFPGGFLNDAPPPEPLPPRLFPPGQFPPEALPPRPFPPPDAPPSFQSNRLLIERQRLRAERAAFLQANGALQTATIPTTIPTSTPTPTNPSTGTATTRINDPTKITVAQIDSFVPDSQNFNHGQEVAKTIESGGVDPSLAGKITILRYSVDGNGTLAQTLPSKTANALQDIVNRVKAGQDIDAVNISLQDFTSDADTARVRSLIQQLAQMNVAVDVAAGNDGPSLVNQLGAPDAFVVQSSTHGKLNASSGPGNITADSSTTSFATASLTPRIAAMMNAGMTLNQVRALEHIGPIS